MWCICLCHRSTGPSRPYIRVCYQRLYYLAMSLTFLDTHEFPMLLGCVVVVGATREVSMSNACLSNSFTWGLCRKDDKEDLPLKRRSVHGWGQLY